MAALSVFSGLSRANYSLNYGFANSYPYLRKVIFISYFARISSESNTMVNGPSFTNATFMSAPKLPV